MKNIITSLLFAIAVFLPGISSGQGENNIWCFGHRAGLDFNSSTPTFFETNMEVVEGSTSISDAAGNLLFYTSGSKVWDRNGNLMPNGTALAGNISSSMRGVVIIPSVSNSDQYYIVTTDQDEGLTNNAYYSVVDMSLNGGLGDAIPSQSSILINTGVAEGVIATPMPDCAGYWFVLHRLSSPEYLAYRVDASGISATPVVSVGLTTSVGNYNFKYPAFNNSGTRVVRKAGAEMDISSFDKTTGILSDFTRITTSAYSLPFVAFSPNDQLLYFSGIELPNDGNVYQLDVSLLPDTVAVKNSITSVADVYTLGLRLSPDNKIYFITVFPYSSLGRINNPDLPGMACNANPNFMAWPSYASFGAFNELGNPVPVFQPDTLTSVQDKMFCNSNEATLMAAPGYSAYQWNTGATSQAITVNQSGTYWVSGRENCTWHADSFHVTFEHLSADLGPDTFICDGQTKVLDATSPEATYLWQDGSTNANFTVDRTGTYAVTISRNGCAATDTVRIEEITPQLSILEPDTTICAGIPLTLHTTGQPASEFLWSNGSTESYIQVSEPGIYTVSATSPCGTLTDEVTVTSIVCNCDNPFVPDAFTPNGDGKNEMLEVILNCMGISDYAFAIYNRYGQRIFESKQPGQSWDGTYNGQQADLGTYFYYLKYKNNLGEEIKKKGDVVLIR